ncbi:MAG: DNA polymerase/3'-5' exonuclease PolX [Chloroflexota bacterium]|nr:DNA polymerase/3'-5' exonuclease PolX [Chloroflexota bacterium]
MADTLQRLADLLEIRGEAVFKIAAYRRAGESISAVTESLTAIQARGELEAVPGVGKAIAQKIADLLNTGSFKLLDEVQAEIPAGVAALLQVPDVGPKRARLLYEKLGVASVDDLRSALDSGQLAATKGIGPAGARRIAEGLASLQPTDTRLPLARALPLAATLREQIRQLGATQVEIAGSVRRFAELVGNVNLVASADDPEALLDAFCSLPSVASIESQDDGARRVVLHDGAPVNLVVGTHQAFGSLLHYHTGSKQHIARLNKLACERGAELNARGFVVDGATHPCAAEDEVYTYLELQPAPPEMREDTGEIERAMAGTLPPSFEATSLRGDLHMHTTWSDGTRSIREMALAARERGYEYVCITDHSQSLGVANGLSGERLLQQRMEIDEVNTELTPFRVLQGVEVEVLGDGSLDLPDDVLRSLDVVTASVHSGLRRGRESVTARALAALSHPLVDVLAHPSGRLVGGRSGGDFDMNALYAVAARTGTALEINGDLARLDLRDTHARAAVAAGCTFTIGSDAHSVEGLSNAAYGARLATRAWVRHEHVLNARPLDAVLGALKRKQ